ncbi:MAG: hypothetical protein H6817_00230 [Phycisphaerales bacterium]|nr:hypothetical protein [Phycisphaerales bacterium]
MRKLLFLGMVLPFVGIACVTAVDPCADVTCDQGESCVEGECVADDPCADIVCTTGFSCVDGACVADDPCEGVTCDEGESCVDGACVADDPCEGVTCDEGESCVDGECVADMTGGDAEVGAAFYATNCSACHADDASGNIGPNIQGFTAAELQTGVEGAGIHGSITIEAGDYADLEAFLATLL